MRKQPRFNLNTGPHALTKIAQLLVQLGDRKDIFWDFLVKLVTPALLRNFTGAHELETERTGLSPEPVFRGSPVLKLKPAEDRVFVSFAVGDHVVNDPRQFVSCSSNGLGSTQSRAHPTVEGA